jgi:hypothetical protein
MGGTPRWCVIGISHQHTSRIAVSIAGKDSRESWCEMGISHQLSGLSLPRYYISQ